MPSNSLSFAVTVHDEGTYVRRLLERLHTVASRNPALFEIVVVDDYSDDPMTLEILNEYSPKIKISQHRLLGDFAAQKNYLNSQCEKAWILQLDADEIMDEDFLNNMPLYIESNPQVEAYWFPRINTVDGLELRHVRDYHWVLHTIDDHVTAKEIDPASEEYRLLKDYNYILKEEGGIVTYQTPIICWPDPQQRLYKNSSEIKWANKVHERLTGFKHFSSFPMTKDYAIKHDKHIKRQEKQNEFYDRLTENQITSGSA